MDDEDDFGDFGGFEAADPAEVQPAATATATPSPWAIYTAAAVQNTTEETPESLPVAMAPDEKEGTGSVPSQEEQPTPVTDQAPDNATQPETSLDAGISETGSSLQDTQGNSDVPNIAWPTVQETPQNSPTVATEGSAVNGSEESSTPPSSVQQTATINEVVPSPVKAQTASSEETQASLKAVQAHRDNLVKELERMSANQARWNKELEECKIQLVHQVDRYDQLQVVHRNAVTEMRNAGHEALSVIVAEYKELSKTTLAHQKETAHTELLSVMDEHSAKWQRSLKEQEEHTKAALAEQKSKMVDELEEALKAQREQLQEEFQATLKEEREKHRLVLQEALEAEREASQVALQAALQEERQMSQSAAREDKVKLQSLMEDERQKSAEAIKKALEEERGRCQECIRVALEDERAHSARQAQSVMDEAKREMEAYVERQKQADAAVRLRSLSTMDIFLEGTRKQLDVLMSDTHPPDKTLEHTSPGDKKPKPTRPADKEPQQKPKDKFDEFLQRL